MTLPNITIALTTWAPNGPDGYTRSMAAKAALASWLRDLHHEGAISIHIADDGSGLADYPAMLGALVDSHNARHDTAIAVEWSRAERHGVGASLNRAFAAAFARGDIVLAPMDDWLLMTRFDLTPWVRLLAEREDVGMVRLGPPHPHISGRIEALTEDYQGWGMILDRHHFAFGHRPALYHQRMIDAYGWFEEGVNAYDCERLYAERFSAPVPRALDLEPGEPAHGWVRPRQDGAQARCGGPALCAACRREQATYPGIVYALPHPWRHLGGTEFADINPREGLDG